MYDVGLRLREMRLKRGITQKMLAEKINKSVAAISAYESSAQTPPTDVLISISEVLHVPITYFVDLDNKDCYSSKGLSNEQKEVVDLLFEELTCSSNSGKGLSPKQVEIIRKLILLFSRS